MSRKSTVESGRRLLGDTLALLKRQLGIIDARQRQLPPGGFDPDVADAAATLARAATGLAAEIRKLEAHDRNAIAKMAPEERDSYVKQYIAELGVERRLEFRILLDELDGGERLLA